MDFNHPERTALEGIERLRRFFQGIGLPVSLKELNIGSDRFEEMAKKCTNLNTKTVGDFVKLNQAAIIDILKLAN